jgi:glycosyltransferase involved in cell wall biosynthesis
MNMLVPHGFEPNYVAGFARGLAANGVSVTVVSDDDIAPRLAAAGIAQRNLRGSHNQTRPALEKAANILRYYLGLLRMIVEFRGGTIHFNGLLDSRAILLDGFLLPLWLRLWAGRYIHTAHNALPHSREKSGLFRWVYRWIYRFPHTIIAHTERVATQLESEFGVARHRIIVISIGLNDEVPTTDLSAQAARERLGLPGQGPIALFFGKVEPYKGVDLLAEAWGLVRTPDSRLVIAGWCPDPPYAERVRSAIRGSSRASGVQWREGFVPNDEVALWLRACDVVVMPYRNIYQSGVVFLCLRFGVPIVATDVGSLSEYVDEVSGIIAPRDDPAGFAAALDCFFASRASYDRGTIARQAMKYSWDRQCLRIKHLYQ